MIPGVGFNLKLCWKFFVILLVFSLTPLIVVTVASQRGTQLLGKTISEDARMRLTHTVGMELRQTAENSAKRCMGLISIYKMVSIWRIPATAAILRIVFLAAAALIGFYMITRSLLRITAAAKKLSSGDFSVSGFHCPERSGRLFQT
jgi:HAMP domain-containing protein